MTRIQTSNELRLAFNFTNSDLQDNRQGFMSYRQKRWLRIKSFLKFDRGLAIVIALSFGLLPLLIITVTFGEMFSNFLSMSMNERFISIFIAVTILILFVIFHWFVVYDWLTGHWSKYNGDIRAGKVSSVQIEINRQSERGFSVLGGEACIKLSSAQLAHLQNNYTYRLYYAPKTCEILSIEIVRVDKGAKDMPISDNLDVAESLPPPVIRLTNNKL